MVDRCNIIYKAYGHFHRHRAPEAATCIAGINNFDGRVQNGDISLIGEMRARCGSVFSAMFCHHTSPEKYYGCTRPVREVLVRLNDRDSFCNTIFSEVDLMDYPTFHRIMQRLKVFYHLEKISNRDLDIMLRMGKNLN